MKEQKAYKEITMTNEEQLREEILKEIDFLCDHWVMGDNKAPYRFGGWREEVGNKLVDIYLSKLSLHDKEMQKKVLEVVGNLEKPKSYWSHPWWREDEVLKMNNNIPQTTKEQVMENRYMKYIKYAKYLARHIWYVRKACWAKGLYWQGLKHDWSKWLPQEFIPYARFFYGKEQKRDGTGYYKPTETGDESFELAWFHHIKFNKHHWQYWSYAGDNGEIILKEMPHKFRLEMLCDWWGASMAQGYGGKCKTWYESNKHKMQLAPKTRQWVEENVLDNFI